LQNKKKKYSSSSEKINFSVEAL